MAKINPCFKRTFVFFNVLFAVLGAVLLGLCLLVELRLEKTNGKLSTVIILGVVGSITFLFGFLGAYGAQKENKNVLIAFFVLMCVAAIALLRMAIPLAFSRKEVISIVEDQLKKIIPLNEASPDVKQTVGFLQKRAKCCGLFNGYRDWRDEIPTSCDCESMQTDQCVKINLTSIELYIMRTKHTNRMVYSESCGFIIMEYFEMALGVTVGVLFGFAILAILGCVMSLAMVIRITALPLSTPPIFTFRAHPPKYSELITPA